MIGENVSVAGRVRDYLKNDCKAAEFTTETVAAAIGADDASYSAVSAELSKLYFVGALSRRPAAGNARRKVYSVRNVARFDASAADLRRESKPKPASAAPPKAAFSAGSVSDRLVQLAIDLESYKALQDYTDVELLSELQRRRA